MKKLFVALALTSAVCAAPVLAADVGVTIRLGEPGFYGELNIGSGDRPRFINTQPVVVVRRYRNLAPIYLRVPAEQSRNWSRYCDRYNACTRPVYFVRDDWYRNVYAPHYRQAHERDQRDDHRDDHRDDQHDGHDARHDDRDDSHGDRH